MVWYVRVLSYHLPLHCIDRPCRAYAVMHACGHSSPESRIGSGARTLSTSKGHLPSPEAHILLRLPSSFCFVPHPQNGQHLRLFVSTPVVAIALARIPLYWLV